ncbi:uncharacterized protein LOC114533887 isoform X2 [Dendronephthya gigantea]|uniref:uncharacterized protein LOC114533887 isoform X2 n=1 Tax=Dendronephthya gigantea TaxID=151771 RepID=UPI001069CE61|nr:uncharacterized protein LOC114533887 isoform X2 [Dendronephthya gigantea]
MAGIEQQNLDPKRTVAVLNVPPNLRKSELTIHFQKSKYGGGDVNDVVVDGNIAFVTFDSAKDATGVLNHPEQTIDDNKVQIQKYKTWLAEKEKRVADKKNDNRKVDEENGVKTIYVSGIKETTTEDLICLFFENKRRTGGGELCEGNQGYKRISPTVARLTFLRSKAVQNILRAANEKPFILDNNPLTVTTKLEPTHDKSILLVKNLSLSTSKETLRDFVETKKNTDVLNVVPGKHGKAIVILESEIDEDSSDDDCSNSEDPSNSFELEESIISLEFAPLTKSIRVSNIPEETTSDSIKYKFSNPKIGGGTVTDITLDENNGVANVYFKESSVVSALVKKSHKINDVSLTVIPYYDEFEELQKAKEVKKSEFFGEYHVEPLVMDYIFNHQEFERMKFNCKSMKYDQEKSTFHFIKDSDDLKTEFRNNLEEFLHSFVKEEVGIPKNVFKKVKETIESKRDEFVADEVDFIFDKSNVTFVGKKQDIAEKKEFVEAMIDQFTEDANVETAEMVVEEKNKLKFLNFIGYFEQLKTDFPGFTIHGTDSPSGKLSLVGRAEIMKDIQLRILQDLMKISVVEVSLSDRQIGFLKWTDCQIVNDELIKCEAMLLLINEAKIFCWKKDNKEKKLSDIVHLKATEKCVQVDEETAKVLAKSGKLHELKKEMFDKQWVLIDQELNNPCNIWIVCENSKMMNAEQEVTSVTDEKKISRETFKPMDRMKVRFLYEHCFPEIKQKERSLEKEGVVVTKTNSDSLEVTGTSAGRKEMILFLDILAGDVYFKAQPLNEPGMKRQMSSKAEDAIICGVGKDYKCGVIDQARRPEKALKTHESPVVADWMVAANSEATAVNLPYRSMPSVDNKERMVSRQGISKQIKTEDDSCKVDGVKTIYVGGIKETTTRDSVCLFFENKRRTGGGELCEGNQGYKRISPTVARLTFLSSKVVKEILRKSNQMRFMLDGNLLRVTTEFEPTHDRSILLVKNLNPSTTKETLKDCVETMKNADVFNVILGEDGKAIVILKSEIGDDSSQDETSSNSENLTKLDGSEISLEFAPFTKGIRVNNIPQKTTSDSIKFKFSNPNIGGGTVTDIMLDRNNGVANVYFEQNSVVSALVKKSHKISDVSLTVIPYYDEFEELQKAKEVKKSEFSGDYHVEPLVMDYIFNHQESERIKFNFKSMKYDQAKSTLHFTKDFDDPKLATEFQNKLKEFLHLFSKEEVKIPKNILNKVKETIESKRDEFDADEVDFIFDKSNVSFVGKKQDIAENKQFVEAMIDQFTEDANVETAEMVVEEKYKLKFLNFIGYFEQLKTDFSGFTIHGTDSPSGKLSLVGRAEKLKDIQLRILQDLMKISVIEVSLSDRQIGFLKWTDCQIVNDELLKDDAMLLLTDVKGKVGAKGLQAKIFCWKKDNKEKKLSDIVHLKTTEKCVKIDEETAKVLAKSGKLQELKREMFEKQEVLIEQEINNPCNIWIICENSKMTNAEQELASVTDQKKISRETFEPMDRMKRRRVKKT